LRFGVEADMDIATIIRRAGLSPRTAPYVLSGRRSVSPETEQRIQAVVDSRPNATAARWKKGGPSYGAG
jgi:DNA-binding LacI/PurR family transcriptional regulator